MTRITIFIMVTAIFLWLSRRSVRNPHSHGFYRFIAFDTTLALLLVNSDSWWLAPLGPRQLVSHLLLILAAVLATLGWVTLIRLGRLDSRRADPALLPIEKTTKLVTTGLYRYIRHPLYGSLICLVLGALLKKLTPLPILLAAIATLFFILTARMEERENIAYFGEAYRDYMRRSRMFIPYVW